MPITNNDLAEGVTLEGTYSHTQLYAGESDIHTQDALIAEGAGDVAKYTLLMEPIAGGPSLPATTAALTAGTHRISGVSSQPVSAPAGQGNKQVAIFTAGTFNEAAITWPAGVATKQARRALLGNLSTIKIDNLG